MAVSQKDRTINKLKADNKRLTSENKKLKSSLKTKSKTSMKSRLKSSASGILIVLAILLLVFGNIVFWTGNTLVNNQRYTATMSPVIKNPAVQQALAIYTTNQIYSNVNVTQYISNVLPPRASFLAPTISSQLQSHTQSALQKVLAAPKFQTIWNNVQSHSQARFVAVLRNNGSGDGTIDVNQLYQQLSSSLANTKLAFLAGHKLPAKVGSIQVLKGKWIKVGHRVVNDVGIWRNSAIVLFVVFGGLGIYLSKRRRRTVIIFSLASSAGMLVTLLGLRASREILAGNVSSQYSNAVRSAYTTIAHPLVVQTTTILLTFIVIAAIAWISGSSKVATAIKARIADLFNGKIHTAIFGENENKLTIWVSKYKLWLQWGFVGIMALIALFARLTPKALIIYLVLIILECLVVEVLSKD
jgi:hypothetical protein